MTEKQFIINEKKIKNNHINYIQVLQNLLSNEGLELTEKRFIFNDDGIITDKLDLSIYINNEDCCEKLNELAEENQQLKEYINELDKKSDELHNEKIRLITENTRLKKKLKKHNNMINQHQGGW